MTDVDHDVTPLRLMAVHAHPDDESSKGAATMAKYVAEGVDVVVVTCTGGERGSILNPAMDRPEVLADLANIRRGEMDRAREILGIRQDWLGFVDSGLPEDWKPWEPLPEDCFGVMDPEVSAEALVRFVRAERPHVMLTYDEQGGYPHPDHIRTHDISMIAFEAAGDPTRYPDAGEPWQPLKLYYFQTFHKARLMALHDAMEAAGLESHYKEWLERWEDKPEHADMITTRVECGDYFAGTGPGADRPRDPDRPGELLVQVPARDPAGGLADRGLPAGPQPHLLDGARGRPVRRHPRVGLGGRADDVTLLADSGNGPGAGLGLVVFLVLLVACILLFRSMSGRIKRLPATFEQSPAARRATTTSRSVVRTLPVRLDLTALLLGVDAALPGAALTVWSAGGSWAGERSPPVAVRPAGPVPPRGCAAASGARWRVTVSTPSISREPSRSRARDRCTSLSAGLPCTSYDSSTLLSVVLTPWPPGPEDREKRQLSS